MLAETVDFKSANRFIPFILIIGVVLGIGEYGMGSDLSLLQAIFIHLITAFIIGYLQLLLITNEQSLLGVYSSWTLKLCLLALFFASIGLLASEIELILRARLINNEIYSPFTGGNIYPMNALIAIIIGMGAHFSLAQMPEKDLDVSVEREVLLRIPVKKGEQTQFVPTDQILYFESYDNYAFLIDQKGDRQLCDSNLKFLETRLGSDFIRVHRKYIVNKSKITSIKPHLNSRYILELNSAKDISITSSKSYASRIRSITKI